MSASKALKQLNLDPKHPDVDMSMLHEAGMHGLMQAINDYEHNHYSGASFATHAGNKMRGLMQTALRQQDKIPAEVRTAQKKYAKGVAATPASTPAPAAAVPAAPKVDVNKMLSHPAHKDTQDRFTRTMTQRQAHGVGTKKPEGS